MRLFRSVERFAKLRDLFDKVLPELGIKGKNSDPRIVIFSERLATLDTLENLFALRLGLSRNPKEPGNAPLAVLYGKLDKHEDAIRHAEKACELEPNDAFSFTAMSVTYQRAWQGTQNPQFIQLAETAMARAHALQSGG